MGDYGVTAVDATNYVKSGQHNSPVTAWQTAVSVQFPKSKSSQNKGSPKGAYLGLCEMGLVCGIPVGSYTKSRQNKLYAVSALKQLCHKPAFANNPSASWVATGCTNIRQNNQMDVVIALWNAGLLKCPPKDNGQQARPTALDAKSQGL